VKKFLFSLLASIVLLAPVSASAANRVMVYAGQNPDTNETNQAVRFQRLADGTFMRDVLGSLGVSGAWSNLAVTSTATSGNYVTVNLSTSNQIGALYQLQVDDANAVPATCPGAVCESLAPDNTEIVVQGQVTSNSANLGPLPCSGCTAGQSMGYVIEGQVSSTDSGSGSAQSILFVSPSGTTSMITVNSQRQDIVTYQVGTATTGPSSTPSNPAADSGWIPIGYVTVPYGTGSTNCNSLPCTITPSTGTNFIGGSFGKVTFGGAFAANGGTSPSVLTTQNFVGCGLNNALGFAIVNPATSNSGSHIVEADLNGDLSVCGTFLYINAGASGSGNAQIFVNTGTDSSGQTQIDLYPATGTGAITLSGTCNNDTICNLGSGKQFFCGSNSAAPTAAYADWQTSYTGADTWAGVIIQVYTVTAGGFGIAFYNASGAAITGNPTWHYQYGCL